MGLNSNSIYLNFGHLVRHPYLSVLKHLMLMVHMMMTEIHVLYCYSAGEDSRAGPQEELHLGHPPARHHVCRRLHVFQHRELWFRRGLPRDALQPGHARRTLPDTAL